MAPRVHPHITIPPGAAPPSNPSPRPFNDWSVFVTPPDPDPLNLWSDDHRHSTYSPISPDAPHPHIPFPEPELSERPPSRAASVQEAGSPRYAFPESQLFASPVSRVSTLRPSASSHNLGHRNSKSEGALLPRPSIARGESRPPSYVSTESSPELEQKVLSEELSSLTIDSEEALRRFQAGDLAENDEEWYRLVPPEAREVLDKQEVQRQSVLFEIIKSERDYVRDLELVRDVFVDPLLNTSPVPQQRLKGFVAEVFYNLDDILVYHRRMLDALFARQREQHPLIQSVADIVLDTSLLFRTPYEQYIKHYPLSEAHHRKELRRNSKYQYFLSQCSQDPRIRKRDIITFLSRPVTRLPRLALLLETAKKCTVLDHPDQESLPIILNILNDFIKSTQPGIEAAESKVKFWALCESLVYQKGEIIDMDLYDESRTLLHSGQLARRYTSRTEVKYTWIDLHVALLDNYLLLLKPELRSNGITRHNVISRPIPLEYLRMSNFDAPPENRREKAHSSIEQSRIFDSFRSRYRQMFPFTIYHASATLIRRYTLYAVSPEQRERWRKALVDAIGLRRVRQDANKFFAPHTISEGFFRAPSNALASRAPGKITTSTPLTNGTKSFIAVGCASGIYVAQRGNTEFKRVLKKTNVMYLHALQEFNKVIVHSDDGVDSYSLELMARVALGASRPQDLDASRERVSGQDVAVVFTKAVKVSTRTMVLYATKSFLQVTLHAMEALPPGEGNLTPRRTSTTGPLSFRSFGEPSWIPKDSHDIVALHKSIGVCAERGIHVLDPTNLSASTPNSLVIPAFSEASQPMQMLKQRCSGAKPLGVIKLERDELLVVFDELGCYIDRHGKPCRSSGYLRWETKAVSYAHRGECVLLFSPEFVEVRAAATGRLLQVIEGQDIRLVHTSERSVLVAMRAEDKSERLVELVETADLSATQHQQNNVVPANVWDEWDM